MSKWLVKDVDNKLPCFSTHNLGVGGVVLSKDRKKLLCIKEQNFLTDLWKFPGGLVDQGETLEQASKREVFEETGIETDYVGVIGFREQLNFRFGVRPFH